MKKEEKRERAEKEKIEREEKQRACEEEAIQNEKEQLRLELEESERRETSRASDGNTDEMCVEVGAPGEEDNATEGQETQHTHLDPADCV